MRTRKTHRLTDADLERLRVATCRSEVDPPLFPGLKQIAQLSNIFTIGLLPPVLREQYGYSWSVVHEAALTAATTLGQVTIRFLPDFIRFLPPARQAMARHAGSGAAPGGRRPRQDAARARAYGSVA
jgi:uncharacterized protein (DUF2236 family)